MQLCSKLTLQQKQQNVRVALLVQVIDIYLIIRCQRTHIACKSISLYENGCFILFRASARDHAFLLDLCYVPFSRLIKPNVFRAFVPFFECAICPAI